jgi:hypothetical protein
MKTPKEIAEGVEKKFLTNKSRTLTETIDKEHEIRRKHEEKMTSDIIKVRTLAVDFDGVIDRYDGWSGTPTLRTPIDLDTMVRELLVLVSHGWKIIIWTNRTDLGDVETYLSQHNIPYHAINKNFWGPENTKDSQKISADVYLDDKAMCFDGEWKGMAEKVMNFSPWWKDYLGKIADELAKEVESECLNGEEKKFIDHVIGNSSPVSILEAAASFFEKKNRSYHYNSNFRQFGHIMSALYPEGFKAETVDDWNLIGLITMVVHKLSRVRQATKGGEGPFEKKVDNSFDLTVYSSMLTSIIAESCDE